MARPIAPTPVLTGKDAQKFERHLENPAPISKERKEAARKAYEAFKAIATFPL